MLRPFVKSISVVEGHSDFRVYHYAQLSLLIFLKVNQNMNRYHLEKNLDSVKHDFSITFYVCRQNRYLEIMCLD